MKVSLPKLTVLPVLASAFQDISDWFRFVSNYTHKRLGKGIFHFERGKDVLVDVLIAKRGRYARHFLNISLLFLVAGAVIGAPIIAEYYPTVPRSNSGSLTQAALYASVSSNDLSTTTQYSDKPRFEILDYEVQKGDVLSTIAEKFGVSADTIRWANNLKSDNLIPGQTLRIPPVTGIVVKVKPGETVYSLAKTYKTDAQKIVNFPANDFADLDTFALNIGQTLIIPDGVTPESAPVYIAKQVPQIIAGGSGKFIWPVSGIITQYPVSYHMALDIANPSAPEIAAADGGVVSYSGCLAYGYGCHIIIDHGDGYQTLYAHLQARYIEAGSRAVKGQAIGKMGSTGRSTGTHLHFEVRVNGVIVNPLGYLGK